MMHPDDGGKNNILDRPVSKGKKEVTLSAFGYLFSELVSYTRARHNDVNGMEDKLAEIGYPIGERVLELVSYREKNFKRETELQKFLRFICENVWKSLFGKPAVLGRFPTKENEYTITPSEDDDATVNKFVSVPKDYESMNCAAFVAGMIKGMLESAGFTTESVVAYYLEEKTVFWMRVDQHVIDREKGVAF
ncbi:Trafficking protein particle complex subunit 5 [Balamuthia mandrillaris]